MSVADDPRLAAIADAHPHRLMFATISGAHLYGFASADSDFDLRGVHVLPLEQVIGLRRGEETIERLADERGLDLDLVTHDVGKFVRLLQKPNGYVLEQVLSPLVVRTTAQHEELRELARRCITRAHVRHYLGFARRQWELFRSQSPLRVKPLLYVYRVLLTGIHLMRSGKLEANLATLNEQAGLGHVTKLIVSKREGNEKQPLAGGGIELHEREYERLIGELERAAAVSTLTSTLSAEREAELHDFLVRVRLGSV